MDSTFPFISSTFEITLALWVMALVRNDDNSDSSVVVSMPEFWAVVISLCFSTIDILSAIRAAWEEIEDMDVFLVADEEKKQKPRVNRKQFFRKCTFM
jgi:hypothetical protein